MDGLDWIWQDLVEEGIIRRQAPNYPQFPLHA
jgi:hypothetical protein